MFFAFQSMAKEQWIILGEWLKSTIRWEIYDGAFSGDVTEMVLMVERKFGDQQHPKYVIKELLEKDIFEKQMDSRLTVFNMVGGSTKFQAIIFKPNSQKILAALPMWTVQRRSWKKYSISYMTLILWYY